MFISRKFEKFTNYNEYICYKSVGAHSIEEARLLKVLIEMQNKYKNPYIRFMWVADAKSAMCVVYSDSKKKERLTKLVSFDEAEKVIMNN